VLVRERVLEYRVRERGERMITALTVVYLLPVVGMIAASAKN